MLQALANLLIPAPEFAIRRNKLHGDEIILHGQPFTEDDGEWLERSVVEGLLRDPAVQPVLVGRFEDRGVGTHRFDGRSRVWRHFVLANYIQDDGYPPGGSDTCLVAYRWTSPTGKALLVFELDC
jgi:hypothetical protein